MSGLLNWRAPSLDQEGQDFWNEKVADWASDTDWTVE